MHNSSLLYLVGKSLSWLVLAGAVIALLLLATQYLIARKMRRSLDRVLNEGLTTIYMPLLNEGTEVWRPVEAMKIGGLGYMVTENAPPDEEWAFQPGQILRCEERRMTDETRLIAVAKAT